jgi:hypothetical protein
MPRKGKSTRKSKREPVNVDSLIMRSNKGGPLTITVPEDLASAPRSWSFTQKPPKNFLGQTHWFQGTLTSTVNTGTTGPTETNQLFYLSLFDVGSGIAAAFDQYAFYCVTVTVTPGTNISIGTNPRVWSAIDYDNVNNIGVAGIQAFGSCTCTTLSNNSSVERFVKPCVDPSLYAGGYGAGRFWVDSGSPTVQHFGVRLIFEPTNSNEGMNITIKAVIAARSNI